MQREEIIARLRAIGYRVTSQREALLDVIQTFDGHFTAEQVSAALDGAGVTVDLSTIYRTFDLLCELGVLHHFAGTQPGEYERVREPHHHLVCQQCGRVDALADYHLDELSRHLREEHQFEADFTHLALPGICHECQAS